MRKVRLLVIVSLFSIWLSGAGSLAQACTNYCNDPPSTCDQTDPITRACIGNWTTLCCDGDGDPWCNSHSTDPSCVQEVCPPGQSCVPGGRVCPAGQYPPDNGPCRDNGTGTEEVHTPGTGGCTNVPATGGCCDSAGGMSQCYGPAGGGEGSTNGWYAVCLGDPCLSPPTCGEELWSCRGGKLGCINNSEIDNYYWQCVESWQGCGDSGPRMANCSYAKGGCPGGATADTSSGR